MAFNPTGSAGDTLKPAGTEEPAMPWFDPEENRREAWDGAPDTPDGFKPTYERAVDTGWPYERSDQVKVGPPHVGDAFRTRQYTHARAYYQLAVEPNGRVKLVARGHLWGDDEDHQQFRAQYRRAAEPTDTEPFGEYVAWMRYQFGTVSREDGDLQFVPDEDRTEEEVRDLSWTEFFRPEQLRMAELELVRNPAFARHVLTERGEWDEVCTALRYNPDAFDTSP